MLFSFQYRSCLVPFPCWRYAGASVTALPWKLPSSRAGLARSLALVSGFPAVVSGALADQEMERFLPPCFFGRLEIRSRERKNGSKHTSQAGAREQHDTRIFLSRLRRRPSSFTAPEAERSADGAKPQR